MAAILADLHPSPHHQGGPASPALGSLDCKPPGRLRTGLEHIKRIDAARLVVGREKDRVSATMDRADDHEIVRQVKPLDAELRKTCPELPAHAGFKILRVFE